MVHGIQIFKNSKITISQREEEMQGILPLITFIPIIIPCVVMMGVVTPYMWAFTLYHNQALKTPRSSTNHNHLRLIFEIICHE